MNKFLSDIIWVAVDTETSGVNPWVHEIIEIGAVKFTVDTILDKYEALVRSNAKHDPKSRAVHNITNEEINTKGRELSDVMAEFGSFIEGTDLIFHNAPFDITFLTLACQKVKTPLYTNTYYDNLFLSRKFFPDRASHSLASLRLELGLETGKSHRALSDAEATARVFMETMQKKGEVVDSKKALKKFMRYNRRFDQFKIELPRNLEEIQKYFDRRIRNSEFMRVKYKDQTGREFNQVIMPKELMIFNQKIYLKANIQSTSDERLIPLYNAVFQDPDLGPVAFH